LDSPGVVAPPPLIYLAGMALAFGIELVWPVSLFPAAIRYPAGAGLIAAGLLVVALAFRRFRTAGTHIEPYKPTTAIVTDGLYGFSRNPIYVAMTVATVGVGILADNVWVFALLVPTLAVMRYGVIAREERYLERKFGDDYLRYKASVRRWL